MEARKAIPGTDYCYDYHEGSLSAIEVAHPAFSAALLLQGGQLIRFRPNGENNWLWLSDEEPFVAGKAVRGGIPICWPWFGAPARNPDAVHRQIRGDRGHGFARLADWELEQIDETTDTVMIALKLDSTTAGLMKAKIAPAGAGEWSGQARVRAIYRFSAEALEVTLETLNTGSEITWVTQALHSYFPTPDIHQTRILGLDKQPYVDALADWKTCEQRGPVTFEGETDRLYQVPGPLQLITPDATLELEPHGSRSAVIWNPWTEKSKTLSHFAPSAWKQMYCVETANVLGDAVSIAPGAERRMGFTLRMLQPSRQ